MTVPSYKRPQILALAPDPASAKAGEGLARRAKWLHYATDGRALWGECQGSGSTPYRTQVDLAGPAFRCSCPSRKFPCKHGLGLMLLHADVPAASAETPDWVGEWLAKRESRAATAPAAPATPAEAAPAPAAKATADPEAAAKRAEKRLARVSAGVEALGLWLADAVRTGLDGAPQQPPGHWREAAARLDDAQAPGLARRVRSLAALVAAGDGWEPRLLDAIARLHLAVAGWRRYGALSPARQADLRALAGLPEAREAVLATAPEPGPWRVLGSRSEIEDGLCTRRCWLRRPADGRLALLLDFAPPGQPLPAAPAPGALCVDALAFYPGSLARRALRVTSEACGQGADSADPPLPDRLDAARAAWAGALAVNPWLELDGLALRGLTIEQQHGRFRVRDADGDHAPLAATANEGWRLLAFGGGRPLTILGEWDGERVRALWLTDADGRTLAGAGGDDT